MFCIVYRLIDCNYSKLKVVFSNRPPRFVEQVFTGQICLQSATF